MSEGQPSTSTQETLSSVQKKVLKKLTRQFPSEDNSYLLELVKNNNTFEKCQVIIAESLIYFDYSDVTNLLVFLFCILS